MVSVPRLIRYHSGFAMWACPPGVCCAQRYSLQGDSEANSESDLPPGSMLIRGCVSLLLVLMQSAKGTLKLAEVNDGISQSLRIMESKNASSKPFADSIHASVTALKSRLQF